MTVNNVTTTNPVAPTTAANPVVKKVQTPAEQRKAAIKAAVKAALSDASKKLVKAAPFIAGAVLPPAIVGTVYMLLNKKPDDKGTGTGTAGQQTGTPDGTVSTSTTTGTGDAGTTTPAAEGLSAGQKIGLGVGVALVALTVLGIYCRPSARKAREFNNLIAKRRAEGEFISVGDIRTLKAMSHKDAIDVLSAPANDDEVARRIAALPHAVPGDAAGHLCTLILNGTVTHRTAIVTLKLMEPAEATAAATAATAAIAATRAAAAKTAAFETRADELVSARLASSRTAAPSKTLIREKRADIAGLPGTYRGIEPITFGDLPDPNEADRLRRTTIRAPDLAALTTPGRDVVGLGGRRGSLDSVSSKPSVKLTTNSVMRDPMSNSVFI